MILIVCLCAVSHISAENPDNTTLANDIIQETVSSDTIQESTDDPASDILQSGDEDVLKADAKSFADVRQQISKARNGGTISLSGYYEGDGSEIVVDKSITIEGHSFKSNGKTYDYSYLDADGQSRIFNIQASGVVIKNLALINGYAGSSNGGAVYCDPYYYDNCEIENCVLAYCEAYYGGATYYCDVYDSGFAYNSAERGGAMYGGNAYDSYFENNTADDRGGAIYVRDGVTIDNCGFENNVCSQGGALYSCADHNTVSNCDFYNNYASDDGGAIYNNDEYDSSLTVSNCNFTYNEADDDGGAIFTSSYADTVVTGSDFYGNEAGYWGGGMCRGSVYDSTFSKNKATRNGGGVYGVDAYDCSFAGNSPNNAYDSDVYQVIIGKIILSQSGSYYGDKTVSARVVDTNNNNAAIANVPVTFRFSNGRSATVYTGSNGVATYSVPFNPGTYSVTATIPSSYSASAVSMGGIKITKASATIQPSKLTTKYGTCKSFKVRVINSHTKKGIGGVRLLLKIYTGKKAKKVYVTTDSSGNAYYSPSKLKVGKHKVKVSIASNMVSGKAKTSRITVKKASLGLSTYDALYYYKDVKKGKYYIGVYNKNSGERLKGMKIIVKVYTGKKAKTYKLKTKKDGYAILKTKGIKIGKHKVKITAKGTKNFKKASAKASIEVSKKMPTRVGYYYMRTTYFYYYGVASRSVLAYVKDMHGNVLSNKKITIYGSYGGTSTGYSGEWIPLPSGSTVVMKFAGDKKYRSSKFTIHFI
jgi:predicted outer membrane repeat protein